MASSTQTHTGVPSSDDSAAVVVAAGTGILCVVVCSTVTVVGSGVVSAGTVVVAEVVVSAALPLTASRLATAMPAAKLSSGCFACTIHRCAAAIRFFLILTHRISRGSTMPATAACWRK